MVSRIIKQGTTQALNVRPFRFAENPADRFPPAAPPLWSDLASIPVSTWNESPGLGEPSGSAADYARPEKAAGRGSFMQAQDAAMEISEQKVEAIMRRYAEAIFEVGRLRSSLYAQVEREVVKLAVEVAKKIVHREIQADREIIQTLVRAALSHVSDKSTVTLHLNPIDYNYLLECRAELSRIEGREISLLADQSIERGGCLIQTECGDIDAGIEEEFREAEQAFFEGLK